MGRADFRLLKELLRKVFSKSIFEGIGVHECWSTFEELSLKHVGVGNSEMSEVERAEGQLG